MVFLFLAITGLSRAADRLNCININTAPKEKLVKIRQIGEARAEQIITLRKEKPFSSVDDLSRVVGIGPTRITDIKEQGLACTSETEKLAEEERPPLPQAVTSTTATLNSTESSSDLLLLPVAIFTSFASGAIILILKRKTYVRT